MRLLIIGGILLFFIFLILSFFGYLSFEKTTNFQVLDSDTNEPIDGAKIYIDSSNTLGTISYQNILTTDSSGKGTKSILGTNYPSDILVTHNNYHASFRKVSEISKENLFELVKIDTPLNLSPKKIYWSVNSELKEVFIDDSLISISSDWKGKECYNKYIQNDYTVTPDCDKIYFSIAGDGGFIKIDEDEDFINSIKKVPLEGYQNSIEYEEGIYLIKFPNGRGFGKMFLGPFSISNSLNINGYYFINSESNNLESVCDMTSLGDTCDSVGINFIDVTENKINEQ